jgi:hypothetical protein
MCLLGRTTTLPEQTLAAILHPFSLGLAFRDCSCDKIVIGEAPNLIHNVVPKRAEIGQVTPDNTVYKADRRCGDGRASATLRVADDTDSDKADQIR